MPISLKTVQLSRVLCMLNRHRPPGRRATWDGSHFVSRCHHCDEPIRRFGKSKWMRDSEAQG